MGAFRQAERKIATRRSVNLSYFYSLKKINAYGTAEFLDRFIPATELKPHLQKDFGQFLIMRVEDMYRHVKRQVPPSRSTTHILILITAGQAYMDIASEKYTARRNELFVIPAGQIFAFEEYDTRKYNKGFICIFDNTFLSGAGFPFLELYGDHLLQPGRTTAANLTWFCERMLKDYAAHGLKHSALLQSCLLALFQELSIATSPQRQQPRTAAQLLTNRFRTLLANNIRSTHLVTDYASMLSVTPNHLNKAVRSVTGRSPSKLIDETLILEAKVLLYQTQLPIGDIAAAIGILDPSYFSRLFKSHTGQTPQSFRSAHKG